MIKLKSLLTESYDSYKLNKFIHMLLKFEQAHNKDKKINYVFPANASGFGDSIGDYKKAVAQLRKIAKSGTVYIWNVKTVKSKSNAITNMMSKNVWKALDMIADEGLEIRQVQIGIDNDKSANFAKSMSKDKSLD